MRIRDRRRWESLFVFMVIASSGGSPLRANLIITPTFDSSIQNDPNAASIEAAINAAISNYEADFINPINVAIDFGEMSSGLGQSSSSTYTIPYSDFDTAYQSNASKDPAAQTAIAAGTVPAGALTNPVTGSGSIVMTTADIRALGITCSCPPLGGFDGIVELNTSITFPPNANNGSNYFLQSVAEHEIDEVLGLGSGIVDESNPLPEDLFRFDQNGVRSYTDSNSVTAFFSLNGTTDLAQFNQQAGTSQPLTSDFGDWASGPLPPGVQPEVQDAFATAGATPSLGVELIALQAIGYDGVPEPGTVFLMAAGLAILFGALRCKGVQPRQAQQ